MTSLAILGTGKMGEALLSGLLRSGTPPSDVIVSTRRAERAQQLEAKYRVSAVASRDAAKLGRTLLLAVKPQDMDALLAEVGQVINADQLVVSMAAGIPTASIERRLADGVPVVRVPEYQQDAVTALSGSGPAYFFFLVEAMIDAGILLGLPRTVAADLMVQTAVGAAVMLRDSGDHPVQLREAVTSPAGTTINAIRELEKHGVRAAFLAAIEAARDRSRELASGHD